MSHLNIIVVSQLSYQKLLLNDNIGISVSLSFEFEED